MVALEEPDKGYAWVVLFCSCIINMIMSGMARMAGILYVGLIDVYGVTRQEASVPFTVRNAVRYLAGPLAGALGQTYGIKLVSFYGGIIAVIGSVLCAFAPTVTWIIVFWGIIHGVGYGLANTLFQVVINQYFEKLRATASGIVLSGACIAAFIFPVMINGMIDHYGLFGCFLLLGGLFLQVLPPSLLLKTPPWIEFPEAYAKKREQLLKFQMKEAFTPEKLFTISCCQTLNDKPSEKSHLHKYISNSSQYSEVSFRSEANFDQANVVCTLYQAMDTEEIHRRNENGISNPAFVPDSKKNFPPVEKETEEVPKLASKNENGFFKNLRNIPQLYCNSVYFLTNLSLATYFFILLPVFTVIVDYTRDKGISRDCENYLIYSLTIGDLLGRLSFGWVTDKKFLSLSSFMMISFVLQSVFIALLPLSESLVINIVVMGLYGVTAGLIFTHIPVLVHNCVEKDEQSIAMGCVGLLSSIATFGIPPLIGYFRDNVGSYDGLFYILAAISMVTAGLWLLVLLIRRFQGHQEL